MNKKITIVAGVILLLVGCLIIFGRSKQGNDLYQLVGKSLQDKEARKFISRFQTEPEASMFDDCFYYSFESDGISIKFNKKDVITAIILYAEGADGFTQYSGKLPHGLSFDKTRGEIENILGIPTRRAEGVGGYSTLNYWTYYSRKRLHIGYDSRATEDREIRMHHLAIR